MDKSREIIENMHLLTAEGFRREVDAGRKAGKTLRWSYECVEGRVEELYGARKYSNFESFKRVYYNKIKKRRR